MEILEISRRKILHYVEQGVILPTVASQRKGKANIYAVPDIIQIAVANHLEGLGIAPRRLKAFMKDFFAPFLVTRTVFHQEIERDPLLMVAPNDFGDDADPTRILKGYEQVMRDLDGLAVFVCGEDEGRELHVSRIESGPTRGLKTADVPDIAASNRVTLVVNLPLIVGHVISRIEATVEVHRSAD